MASETAEKPGPLTLDKLVPELIASIASFLTDAETANLASSGSRAILAALRPVLHTRLLATVKRLQKSLDLVKRTKDVIKEKEDMGFKLVWYARSLSMRPDIVAKRAEVEEKWPEETDKLNDPEGSTWQHGFNSGQLATTRLVLGMLGAKEDAESTHKWRIEQWDYQDSDEDPETGERPSWEEKIEKGTKECFQRAIDEFPFLDS